MIGDIESAMEKQAKVAKTMVESFSGKNLPPPIFDYILSTAETIEAMAREAAKGISVFDCSARDVARQRRMNNMVDHMVIMIEELANVTVACSRNEDINSVPFPPRINRQQTLLNFKNKR